MKWDDADDAVVYSRLWLTTHFLLGPRGLVASDSVRYVVGRGILPVEQAVNAEVANGVYWALSREVKERGR